MEPYEPQFDPDNNSENVQSIVDRMGRAGWLTGNQMVKRDQWWINLSEKGKERVHKVADALIETAPHVFKAPDLSVLVTKVDRNPNSVKQPTVFELAAMMLKMYPVITELQPPPFSPGEYDTLIAMFYYFARQKATGKDPSL